MMYLLVFRHCGKIPLQREREPQLLLWGFTVTWFCCFWASGAEKISGKRQEPEQSYSWQPRSKENVLLWSSHSPKPINPWNHEWINLFMRSEPLWSNRCQKVPTLSNIACIPSLPHVSCYRIFMIQSRAGEIAQQLSILAALSEDKGSVPSTYIGQLPTACNSYSREPSALFWPPEAQTFIFMQVGS